MNEKTETKKNGNGVLKKAGAGVGITGLSAVLVWNIYSKVDERVRTLEKEHTATKVHQSNIYTQLSTIQTTVNNLDGKIDKIIIELSKKERGI